MAEGERIGREEMPGNFRRAAAEHMPPGMRLLGVIVHAHQNGQCGVGLIMAPGIGQTELPEMLRDLIASAEASIRRLQQ